MDGGSRRTNVSGSSVAARENVTAAICWRVAGVKKCECARNKEILAVVGAARRGTRIGTRIERRRRMRYTPRPCSWNPGSRSRPAISRGKLETMRHRSHREKPVPLFGSISAEIAFHFYIIAKIRMRYREKGERPRSGFWRIFRNDDRSPVRWTTNQHAMVPASHWIFVDSTISVLCSTCKIAGLRKTKGIPRYKEIGSLISYSGCLI